MPRPNKYDPFVIAARQKALAEWDSIKAGNNCTLYPCPHCGHKDRPTSPIDDLDAEAIRLEMGKDPAAFVRIACPNCNANAILEAPSPQTTYTVSREYDYTKPVAIPAKFLGHYLAQLRREAL